MFAWGDKGLHYFMGEGSDARIVSSTFLDAPMAERVAARARTVHEKAGLLSGYALGKVPRRSPARRMTCSPTSPRWCRRRKSGCATSGSPPASPNSARTSTAAWKGENVTSGLKPHPRRCGHHGSPAMRSTTHSATPARPTPRTCSYAWGGRRLTTSLRPPRFSSPSKRAGDLQQVAVRGGLPEQYATTVDLGAGCGLRQGEIFGLAVDEVDFDGECCTSHGRSS